MNNYNLNKYREWLNEDKEKLKGGLGDNKPDSAFDKKQLAIGVEDETGEHTKSKQIGKEIAKDHLSKDPEYYKKAEKAGLGEEKKQLSKYWKIRAKRRAKRAGRGYPNNEDKNWAVEQQTKSESINNRISKLFEKDLTIGEELSNNIDEYLKKIKEERASMFNIPKSFGKNKKPKGSISVPLGPEYGGVVKGYKKKLKKLKNKGIVGVAPGEAFGPMQENLVLDENVITDLYNKAKDFLKNANIKIDTASTKAFIKAQSFLSDFNKEKINLQKDPNKLFDFLKKYNFLIAAFGMLFVFLFNKQPPPEFVVKMILAAYKGSNINDFLIQNKTDIQNNIPTMFTEAKLAKKGKK
jgi:hypothetical protein